MLTSLITEITAVLSDFIKHKNSFGIADKFFTIKLYNIYF